MSAVFFMMGAKHVDHPHPAATEPFNDPVMRDGLADHSWRILRGQNWQVNESRGVALGWAHVVEYWGANHFVFLSNEADVLRELRAFLPTLR